MPSSVAFSRPRSILEWLASEPHPEHLAGTVNLMATQACPFLPDSPSW